MDLRAALTDPNGNPRAYLDDAAKITLTPRLGSHWEAQVEILSRAVAGELSVGNRAIQVYDDTDTLRFFGKVWEPLSIKPGGITIPARDPLAEFLERRAHEQATYTLTNNAGGPWDAGQIVYNRLALQNAERNTYLRAGTRAASVNRERTVLPGALERDLIDELANAEDGYFYRAVPVHGVPGVMADLDILYPDAGVTRDDVVFAYGAGTDDNLVDYEKIQMLPRNRYVAATSGSTGGRIANAAEVTTSIAEYGLFDADVTFSDVTDLNLLQQHADAEVQDLPPVTYKLIPGAEAPLLLRDFNVGDFVLVLVRDEGLDLAAYARVLEGTLEKSGDGQARLSAIDVELLIGGVLTLSPERRFRKRLDEQRRRLEALERRQQHVTETAVASPSEPAPSGGEGGGGAPSTPTAPAPPPAAPASPPVITGVSATGVNYRSGGVLHRGIEVTVSFDTRGLAGTVSADGASAAVSGASSVSFFLERGPGSYTVTATVSTSAGSGSGSDGATVPAVTAE